MKKRPILTQTLKQNDFSVLTKDHFVPRWDYPLEKGRNTWKYYSACSGWPSKHKCFVLSLLRWGSWATQACSRQGLSGGLQLAGPGPWATQTTDHYVLSGFIASPHSRSSSAARFLSPYLLLKNPICETAKQLVAMFNARTWVDGKISSTTFLFQLEIT